MMSYFGTDQSQVQRYLTARSDGEARNSLLISAYWKIPLQALVLLVGVLVFVYYVFVTPPLLFNPAQAQALRAAEPAAYRELNLRYLTAVGERGAAARVASLVSGDPVARTGALTAFQDRNAAVEGVRDQAMALAERVTGEPSRDVNYIIPWFVLHGLPVGLAGIFVAAIMAAAMSAVSAELNSLATVTVIDYYRRWVRPQASDAHFLWVSKAATGFWGLFACVVATFAATLGSLIEVVNRFGSFFYGSILGVFLLAMIPGARAIGAFVGLIAGMTAVGIVNFGEPSVSFLWHNVIGAVTVVLVGMALSVRWKRTPRGMSPASR
jgi:Na+/proline symporter